MCVYCKYRICTVRLQGASDNADLSFQLRAGADLRADHAADQAADPVRRAAPRRRTAQHPAFGEGAAHQRHHNEARV